MENYLSPESLNQLVKILTYTLQKFIAARMKFPGLEAICQQQDK